MTPADALAALKDVRYTKLRYHLWWGGNWGHNTNRSHADDQPPPPVGPSSDERIAAHVLRIVAGYRVPDWYLRQAIRACADRLDPRPGTIDFPAERTRAPTQEGASA